MVSLGSEQNCEKSTHLTGKRGDAPRITGLLKSIADLGSYIQIDR